MKSIDQKETYIVREMFGCGEGHVQTPGFTHWESGEACILRHEDENATNEYYHMYYRLYLVPLYRGTKEDPYSQDNGKLWDYILGNPGKWAQFPLAPEGLKEGQMITPKEVPA